MSSLLDDNIPLSSLHVTEFRSSFKFISLVIAELVGLHVTGFFRRREGADIISGNDKSRGDAVGKMNISYNLLLHRKG